MIALEAPGCGAKVPINWGSSFWVTLQQDPYCFEACIGAPDFGSSHILLPEVKRGVIYQEAGRRALVTTAAAALTLSALPPRALSMPGD